MMNESTIITRGDIQAFFMELQDDICQQLEAADGGGQFREDPWDRPGGGGGRTRIFSGQVIEKGGVNFSAVHGALPENIGKALRLPLDHHFFASGVSIVLHPYNPHVPIIHMNVRYFEITDPKTHNITTWWFGGGIDLTPHYVVPEDAARFHRRLQAVCAKTDPKFYSKFKQWADDYFYLKHRDETRGVGGIFFDRLNEDSGKDKHQLFSFVQAVGHSFAPIYTQLMRDKKDLPFSDLEKEWQMHRRGRYVEFNLVWDRGTKFGLDTKGRTESILMSMPPTAQWTYSYPVIKGSKEEDTLSWLRKGVDWVALT